MTHVMRKDHPEALLNKKSFKKEVTTLVKHVFTLETGVEKAKLREEIFNIRKYFALLHARDCMKLHQ